jgi:hypothetical protein
VSNEKDNYVDMYFQFSVNGDSKEGLFKKWGTNYSLIKILLEADMEAYDYLSACPSDSVSDEVMTRLLNEWYPHMSLIKTLYDADMKAYKELQ